MPLGQDGLSAWTDEDGRFRLEGLLERAYRVQVFEPESANLGREWRLAAGSSGVRLMLEDDPDARRVAGRVVSATGEPLPGIDLWPLRSKALGLDSHGPPWEVGKVTTDADGAFDFGPISVAHAFLQLSGPGILLYFFPLEGELELERLEIEIGRLCELQVVLEDVELADHVRILDSVGEKVRVLESFGSHLTEGGWTEIVDGRTSVLQVDERAAMLVLMREGSEVERLPLRVDPGRRTVFRR